MLQEIQINKTQQDILDYSDLISKTLVDLSVKVDRPETLISIGEHQYKDKFYPTSVMTAGEFSCIVAPSKSKKSFLKSAVCAAYVGGNSGRHFTNIKGHRDKDYYILDIDTEQSNYYARRTFKRVAEMTGMNYKNHIPFKMRALSVHERLELIKHLLYKSQYSGNIKLVFIDGIADLMLDVNDMEMSNIIANYLLKWTEELNIHICVVIHAAFGTSKATGNLGSTLIKKAESVLMLSPTDDSKKVIKTIHQYSRGYSFEAFHFSIKDKDALPYRVGDFKHEFDNESETFDEKLPFINPDDAFDNDIPF
jgi:hypothetical protein